MKDLKGIKMYEDVARTQGTELQGEMGQGGTLLFGLQETGVIL